MKETKALEQRIFTCTGPAEFEALALDVFRFQAVHCKPYTQFISSLGVTLQNISGLAEIPFMPIEFFKRHEVVCFEEPEHAVFSSSGTTGMSQSRHYVKSLELYEESFTRGFELFYGPAADYCFLALLPGYLERRDSSLIYMVKSLIERSGKASGGFYLNEFEALQQQLEANGQAGQKTVLIGVSFALLDFAMAHPMNLQQTLVMETGGMKGKHKEFTRSELHTELQKKLGVKQIHSEYGMTELLSQAYSNGFGLFQCPPWMKVLIREINDPLAILPPGKTGGINVIDLANLYSCSFLATSDLGKMQSNGQFEVLGRFDNSDLRGCNLLLS